MDKEQGWVETWADFDAIVSDEIQTSRNFVALDITKKSSYEKFKKPFEADIFTSLYFLSEIYSLKEKAEEFFDHIWEQMKPGALFVAIDFQHSELQTWIDGVAENNGLEILETAELKTVMGSDEEKSVLKEYIAKFGPPKLQSKIMFRVYRKPK